MLALPTYLGTMIPIATYAQTSSKLTLGVQENRLSGKHCSCLGACDSQGLGG